MDERTQKERLGQELRFLKESYEAEVISKEEFEKGKERVEVKLKEINQLQENPGDIEKKEDEKTKNETAEEAVKETAKIKAERRESVLEAEEQKKDSNDKHGGKLFRYAAIFIILILAAFFSYSIFKEKKETSTNKERAMMPLCSSNDECKMEGMEGACLNPSTKDAKCQFKEITKINVLIINDRNSCFNCDTKRVVSILEEWFGSINAKEIDYNTDEGKSIAEKLDAKLLPAYILDENITKKQIFEQSKQAFIKKNESYILSDDASGSTFYFKRENVQNKLDLFVKANDIKSVQAEKNLQEFFGAFKEVKFEKYSSDGLTKELGIKVYPTFLINNRVKFTGVQPAEVIKENFCKLNNLPNCNSTLSKSLV